MATLKWNRSEDGVTESKCGRYVISANYNGGQRAYSYTIQGPGFRTSAYGVKAAKAKAERHAERGTQRQARDFRGTSFEAARGVGSLDFDPTEGF